MPFTSLGAFTQSFFFFFSPISLSLRQNYVEVKERGSPSDLSSSLATTLSHIPFYPEIYFTLSISIFSQFVFSNQEQSGATRTRPLKFSWKRSPTDFLIIRSNGWHLVINSRNLFGHLTIQNGSVACGEEYRLHT